MARSFVRFDAGGSRPAHGVRVAVGFSTAALLSAVFTGCEAPPIPEAELPRVATRIEPTHRPALSPEQIEQLDGVIAAQGAAPRRVVEPTISTVAWLDDTAEPKSANREVIAADVTRADERLRAAESGDAETQAAGNAGMDLDAGGNGSPTPPNPDGLDEHGGGVGTKPLYDPPRTREALLAELHERLAELDAPPLRRALAGVGLSLTDPTRGPDERLLEGLDPAQRRAVEAFHALLVDLAGRIDSGEVVEVNADTVAASLADEPGERTVSLRNPTLCRKVSGFGVYEPFDSDAFLAGRENRVIVYAEIDGFVSERTESGDHYEVKLEQEVVLFNEADGLAVWRHPAQPVRDTSRRQRRDFWVVQMVTLPANLGVGKYRLKVRVTDHLGGTVDETTLPIRMVADQSARESKPVIDSDADNAQLIREVMKPLFTPAPPDIGK